MAGTLLSLFLVAVLVGWHVQQTRRFQQRGRNALSSMLDRLQANGYTVPSDLSGKFAVGTVLQVSEVGADGSLDPLSPPVVFLWADRCFPGVAPRSASYLLEETQITTSTTLQASAEDVASFLPSLALNDAAVSKYSLSFVNPKTETYAAGDLSQHFAKGCVLAYAAALRRAKPESFAVILDTVVVDEILYQIEWRETANADARLAVTQRLKRKLEKGNDSDADANVGKGTMQVQLTDEGTSSSRLSGKGRIVLAYRARGLDPVRASELAKGN